MANFIRNIRKFFTAKEEGASLVEYGLLVGLIALACIVMTQVLGQEISTVFGSLTTSLAGI